MKYKDTNEENTVKQIKKLFGQQYRPETLFTFVAAYPYWNYFLWVLYSYPRVPSHQYMIVCWQIAKKN